MLSHDHTSEKLDEIKAYVLSVLNDTSRQVDSEFAAIVKRVMDGVASLESLYAVVLPDRQKSRRGIGGPQVRPGVRSRRKQKAEVYRYLKKTYRYSPKTVAEKILNGTASYEDLSCKEGFTADDYVKARKPIFKRSDEGCAILNLNVKEVRWDLMDPIKISDIADSIKRTKNSTPGPDGYRLKDVLARLIEQFTILLNLIMLYGPGQLPAKVSDSRVTLIKKIREPRSPLNYWPIVVGNFTTRIFHCILAFHIEESLSNHPSQVGFQHLDGVAYNMLKLQKTLGDAWSCHEALVTLILDLQKAFDSVSHRALHRTMLSRGFPTILVNYIRSSMESTNMIVGDTLIKPTGQGVKQGDSLSPALFNLTLDTALFKNENPLLQLGLMPENWCTQMIPPRMHRTFLLCRIELIDLLSLWRDWD